MASSIILLATFGRFDLGEARESVSLDNRLERAWSHFQLYLAAARRHVGGLRSFSRAKMHFVSGFAYPWLGCKAGDVPTLLKWLLLVVSVGLSKEGLPAEQYRVLGWMEKAASGGLFFTQAIHGHAIWLPASCAVGLRSALVKFNTNYCRLAQWCLTRNKPLYGLTPKLHAMSHFRHDLDMAFASGKQVFRNPAIFDCGVSEDFVGRVSRQSRRIAFKRRTFVQQLLNVYKLKVRFVLTAFLKKLSFATTCRGKPVYVTVAPATP